MIELGSLVGFAVAFLAIGWVSSLVIGTAWLCAKRRIAELGPALERTSAVLALALPPLIAAVAIIVLIGRSHLARGELDHCPVHVHHPHLCLYHGGIWASTGWAVAIVALFIVLLGAKLGDAIARASRAWIELARLRRASSARRVEAGVEIVHVDSPRAFCFTAGLLEPRVYLSSSTIAIWSTDEQRAGIAHELGHARARDLLFRIVLATFALFGAPRFNRLFLDAWMAATERLRDEGAARVVGDPSIVASALVSLARAGIGEPRVPAMSIASGDLEARVDALLSFDPNRRTRSSTFMYSVAAVGLMITTSALVFGADHVHHLLETIFGAV